jgi:hypothetical protein
MTPFFSLAFAAGLAAVAWIAAGFAGTSWLALAMTVLIAAVYLAGAYELRQFRAASAQLARVLANTRQPPAAFSEWLQEVPPSLRDAVRLRVEGARGSLPPPALTPYLVGLLVMLGMLGTFLGMVVTFKGAVFALERSTDLQAMRATLAEPIRGLGLSFGTSVAGVAASAMLGLMAAVSRRERLDVARALDQRIAGVLLPFSLVHQRQEGLRALQAQAQVLPGLVERLDAMMLRMEQRSERLDAQLLERHGALQHDVTQAYEGLARKVAATLQDSVAANARTAADAITPVVDRTMAEVAAAARSQVENFNHQFEQRSTALLATLQDDLARREETLQGEWRRMAAEAAAQQEGMARTLAALRVDEAQRGEAAVARLGELQAAVAQHLAQLGAALEEPLTRLLHTASEVPQAASGVITQLRQETSRLTERDNRALEERAQLLEQIRALLEALNAASGEQRAATQALLASAGSAVDQAGERFGELSTVAESFGQGVQAFQASNDKLVESLERMEASLRRSTARSDEQLAYYVAQAREVIDLSIASQQGLVENLRALQGRPAKALALADGEAG